MSNSAKYYENLVLKHDKFVEETTIALSLVKKYIVKNKYVSSHFMSHFMH